MAGKKDNIKALFKNTRTRIIILFTVILLIASVVIGYFKLSSSGGFLDRGSANVGRAPGGIRSIPGQLNQTEQYAALQNKQNVDQAEAAKQSGSSAIPTIIKTQAFGEGVDLIGPQYGEGGLGFTALSQSQLAGTSKSLWADALEQSRCSSAAIRETVEKGATLNDLREACNCCQLRQHGYSLQDLDPVCSCLELKAAGFSAREMKVSGYSADKLYRCGFSACESKSAGFSAEEMKDGGYSNGELKGAGFTQADIDAAMGLPFGMSSETVEDAGCSPEKLANLRKRGLTAAAVQRINACNLDDLKAAGYDADQLKRAGASAAELKGVGFNPKDLKKAGYQARELLNAGFDPSDLTAAGFEKGAIDRANTALPPGVTRALLKQAGCSVEALKIQKRAGVSAKALRQNAGCSAAQLKAAGFYDDALTNAGFTPEQLASASQELDKLNRGEAFDPAKFAALKAKGISASKLRDLAGSSASQLKAAGFNAKDLLGAGFSDDDLLKAGFNPDDIKATNASLDGENAAIKAAGIEPGKLRALKAKGVSAKKLRDLMGGSASHMKSAGFNAKDLLGAGFSDDDLLKAGFNPDDISAGKSALASEREEIKAAGTDATKLRALKAKGISAKKLRDLTGSSASQLKASGFNAKDLLDAGFSDDDLRNAGFNPDDIKAARAALDSEHAAIKATGVDPNKLRALKAKGVSAKRLKDLAGSSAAQLKAAGFDAKDLMNAGFSDDDLRQAGFAVGDIADAKSRLAGESDAIKAAQSTAASPADLRGKSPSELKASGYSAKDLLGAGFSPAELLDAGYDSGALNSTGLIPSAILAAGRTKGCNVKELAAARRLGVSAATIKESLGCSAEALKAAGYNAQELKDAGYSAAQLKKHGISPRELRDAGYSADDLKDAGVSESEIKALGLSVKPKPAPTTPSTTTQQQDSTTDESDDTVRETPITKIPSLSTPEQESAKKGRSDTKELQQLLARQQTRMSDQRYQAKIKQLTGRMVSSAQQALQEWRQVPGQVFIMGSKDDKNSASGAQLTGGVNDNADMNSLNPDGMQAKPSIYIKTGDIIFAVLDTAVNTDEPGPILATVVSGKLKGSKLIGSFTLPANADQMVITFNTLSMLGADQTIGISAYAIDPSTARTALSSRVNHHYLMRYGGLFASTFLSGFSTAIQSADTTITIGGTGGTTDTTVQNGINRSLLENALIGLGEVGKAWSETASQLMSRPTTVELFSGTGMGILFTQDVQIA